MQPRANTRERASPSEDPDFIPPKTRAPRANPHRNRAARLPAVKKTKARGKKSTAHRQAITSTMMAPTTATAPAPETTTARDPKPLVRRTDGPSDGLRAMCAAISATQVMDNLAALGLSPPDDADPKTRVIETINRLASALRDDALPGGEVVSETDGRTQLLQYVQMAMLKYLAEYL